MVHKFQLQAIKLKIDVSMYGDVQLDEVGLAT